MWNSKNTSKLSSNFEITFLTLINKSRLQGSKYFVSLEKIHEALNKVDMFFKIINARLKKRKVLQKT